MLNSLAAIFSIPDLRKKVFFTLAMLVVFRFGAHIPIPGIDIGVLSAYMAKSAKEGKSFTDLIDLFAGGAFKNMSVFALGIMPYISASIIMQLMMVVVPSLQKLQKEGEYGRKKINQYTRYGTVLICSLQSFGIAQYVKSIASKTPNLIYGGFDFGFIALTILSITTGTIILMWLGELMTEKGIGNGISILIFAGIIAAAPAALVKFGKAVAAKDSAIQPITVLILFVVFIAMIGLSIVLTEGTRKIPLQYGKKVVGRRIMQGASQTLPIKVNAANVMPIIFASSLMLFPSQIGQYLDPKDYKGFSDFIRDNLTPGSVFYTFVYVVMIVFFAYFYTAIQYNPKEIAEQLKKNGGYVPGIRPGAQTEEFLEKILNRLTLSGAIFLAFIAIAPDLIVLLWNLKGHEQLTYLFGGTSLLIIVGVALDTLKQIESQLIMRHYDGFMDKSKKQMKRPRMVR